MNIKKIGLTALAGSLVATSAFAGEMSVAGGASITVEHKNGTAADSGKSYTMGNQLTFSGSGELDNGLNVSLSFVIDQGDDASNADGTTKSSNAGTPFDSHSVTISSDTFGSVNFAGEGGSSATSALDATAAGDIWDQYDDETGLEPSGVGSGDNMFMYTTPSLMEGLTVKASFLPSRAGKDSAVGFSGTYTGVEGLTVSYAHGDSNSVGNTEDATVLKGSYAYGPLTLSYSDYEYDAAGTSSDDDVTSYKLSYTVSDEISISYGTEDIDQGTKSSEYERISVSYTAGGMTISASMSEATDMDGTTTATEDAEKWSLGASFAF